MKTVIASFKLAGVTSLIAWIIIIQTPILWFTRGPKSYFFTRLYHAGSCKVLGLKYEVVGKPVLDQQTLYVCNHISYLDISVIGSIIRQASFIAKKEAREMPVYGYLSTMQQTAFISRDRKDVKHEKNALDNMAAEGKSLILFPEGTSTDGREVLPFKSSLFGIVLKDNIKEKMIVQPMTISLIEANGQNPNDQDVRELYAWSREMTIPLTAHIWRLCKKKGATVRVEFHAPLTPTEFKDRKALAKAAEEKTAAGLYIPNTNQDTGLDSKAKAA
ncbi:MAG: lysophospholipid acyltransferase family protein [Pseudomonadota bacterium]